MYKKILIISISGIGDSLLFSPALKLLENSFPEAEFHVLVMFKSVANYFSRFSAIKKIHYYDFANGSILKGLRYIWNLRREKYDMVINGYPSNRAEYNIVAKILGKSQAGHKYLHFNIGNLFFLNKIIVKENKERHPVLENIAIAKAIGADGPVSEKLLFPLLDTELKESVKWINTHELKGRKLIGFHAGSGILKNHINKRWPKEKFIELGKSLRDKHNLAILVFGGLVDKDVIKDISSQIGASSFQVIDTSLGVSAALISKCSLFVSNDTALMHIAAALQVPCVAIFGPTDIQKGRPYNSPHIIASKYLSCSPCFYYSPKPLQCKWKTFECLRDLDEKNVEECCNDLIKNASK